MISVEQLLSSSHRARAAIAVTIVAVVAGASFLVYRHSSGLPDDAVLRYDDHVVTQEEYDARVDTLAALYGIAKPDSGGEREEFDRDMAKSIAVSLILDDAAAERDIVISEKSTRDTLASMLEQQLGPQPQKQFSDLLAEFGVSEADILDEIARQQTIARLFREITQDAVDSVTIEDAKAYYAEDPSAFAAPERRRLANVVVATRRDAQDVLRTLQHGAAFGSVARARSLDDATRSSGGVLGLVSAAALDPTYADAAFAARPGSLFGPVKSQYGWNVGQVTRVLPAIRRPFAKVEPDVIDALRSERAMDAWREWLGDEIKAADVEYADAYLPDDPDAPPALSVPGQEGTS